MAFNTPAFWYQPRSIHAQLLRPLSWLYGLGRWLDVRLHHPKAFAVPVWCVGNAVAGGAGKTPTTLALLQRLAAAKPHVVTRGYGGTLSGPVRVDPEQHDAAAVGDEPLLLAGAAPTWVAKNRVAGINAAIKAGAGLVLLDDGLQNTTIKATRNILVVDSASGFGNGLLLPAGPLREPLQALTKRVDACVIIGDGALDLTAFANIPQISAQIQADARALDISARYLAFSGIARPEKFFASARACGLQVVQTLAYPDHHAYTLADWHRLLRLARECDAQLLTTGKDAMRLSANQRAQVRQLPITLRFSDEAALQALLQNWQGT